MTDAPELVATIEGIFAAIGDDDRARLEQAFCDDFHAFENGVRVSRRELLDLMRDYHAQGRRYRWSVVSPQVEVQGDLGIVVYVNRPEKVGRFVPRVTSNGPPFFPSGSIEAAIE